MRTGSYGIGPDHLFLGLIRQEDNEAFRTLQNLGVEPAELKAFIDQRIFTNETIPYDQIDNINFSRQAQNVLSITVMEATRLKSPKAETHHLLLALCRTTESYGQAYLRARGIDYGRLLAVMEDEGLLKPADQAGTPQNTQPSQGPEEEQDPEKKLDIEEFAYDLTQAARDGKLDPVVGRDTEITRVIQILGRRKKNNPMLIGEPGVGKSAIVEGIALKIASGNISAALAKKRILSLDIASVVAGTKYRGDFEKRLKTIIQEASETISPELEPFPRMLTRKLARSRMVKRELVLPRSVCFPAMAPPMAATEQYSRKPATITSTAIREGRGAKSSRPSRPSTRRRPDSAPGCTRLRSLPPRFRPRAAPAIQAAVWRMPARAPARSFPRIMASGRREIRKLSMSLFCFSSTTLVATFWP